VKQSQFINPKLLYDIGYGHFREYCWSLNGE